MDIDDLREIENMLAQSIKSMRCALRRMKEIDVYNPKEKNLAIAIEEASITIASVRLVISNTIED